MHVALVSRQLATHPRSGLNRATCDLATGLAAAGHAVHVLTEAADGFALPGALRVHDVGDGDPVQWAAAAHDGLVRLHAAGELDVALVPLWSSAGLFAARDPRFPTVISCMTSATTIGELDPAWAALPDSREAVRLERLCVGSARHLHGLTRSVLEKTLRDYGGAPVTAAVVARGLRDVAPPPAERPAGPVEVLFVGRLEPRKGVDVLLEAVRALVAGGVDLRLTLVGDDVDLADGTGGYRRRFAAAAAPELAARVCFAGPVSDHRLHALYAASHVVCQPSRYESHGIVLIEAMMFGRPLVTTTGGGIAEVAEAGGNALLVEPGDAPALAAALRTLVEDEPLRRRFAARSRELYETRFELGVVVRAMEGLLEDAIRADGPDPSRGLRRLRRR